MQRGRHADFLHIITPYSLDYNGNAITVSNELWEQMQANDPALNTDTPKHPISANSLKPIVDSKKSAGNPMRMGMVFPVSTHNYEIRYCLAASGDGVKLRNQNRQVGIMKRPKRFIDLTSIWLLQTISLKKGN